MLKLKSYAREGLNDKEIADHIGISKETFYKWIKKYSDFSDSIKKGREPINTIVEDTFFETKLKPQFIKETTTETTIHYDANGKETGKSKHKKVTERYIPADTTAMLFYMKCRMSDKYNDRVNVNIENSKELPKLYQALESEGNDDVREAVGETEESI